MATSWIRTDATADVAGAIRHIIRAAQCVGEDSQACKWVVLAIHSALQGACVCHLTTTAAPVGAVSPKNASDWLAYFENSTTNPNTKPPKTHLMRLPELLVAVRKPYSAGDRSNAVGVVMRESELDWLRRFDTEIRNQFVHFEPKGWSIEVSGIPEIAKLVARIIGDILQIGWAFRHQDITQREKLQSSLQILASIESPESHITGL